MNVETELQQAENKLAERQRQQEHMKKINDAHKKYVKNPDSLAQMNLTQDDINQIVNYVPQYSWVPHPYAPYELTNNGAEIRRLTKRIEELNSKSAEIYHADGEAQEFTFDGGKVIYNYEIDRVQIIHDQKPEPAMIAKLKDRGFNWSPTNSAWQRKLTENGKMAAKWITGLA